ncbi:MAG: DUF2252 family protein [Polyangiaceae bacterium]|nr:DUF2252 family protein [Polyangiaceae bacterium]
MARPRSLTLPVMLLVTGVVGCPQTRPVDGPTPQPSSGAGGPEAPDPMALRYDAAVFAGHEPLVERLRSSDFAYFRYLAAPFAKLVCEELTEEIAHMPTVNLHGDLHLEQYAIADDGFGIVDFDDATKGPPILDWLRFATSIWLATDDADTAEYAIARFIDGYRAGLAEPNAVVKASEPAAAKRIRARFKTTPAEWLDKITGLIQPIDPSKRAKMERARSIYVAAMRQQNPDLSEAFFTLKVGGALKMGIGSAHEDKFLVRVEGPSDAPSDDVILESKQMKHQLLGSCVRGDARDPTRVIAAQAKFSRSPQRLLGYVAIDDNNYYVHAWRVHYTELDIADVHGRRELAELTYDVGLQLGRGHPTSPATTPEGIDERRVILKALDQVAGDLFERSRAIAERTTRGYDRFREATARPGAPRVSNAP